MKVKILWSLLFFFFIAFAGKVHAVPSSLDGMGLITQWTDFENQSGDMPGKIWGQSDTLGADKIGLYVEFANGVIGNIVYSGISSRWNTTFTGIAAASATGFFSNAIGLHFLYNSPVTFTYPQALPMAWEAFVMPFSNNFDLDYNQLNTIQSNFRASVTGWGSGVFATYSSAVAIASVPETGSLILSVIGLVALGFYRKCQ